MAPKDSSPDASQGGAGTPEAGGAGLRGLAGWGDLRYVSLLEIENGILIFGS